LSAAERIRRHAGPDQPSDETALTVSAASDRGSPAEVEAATADLVDALDSFNRELNGEFPSKMSSGESDVVPRDVTYAVAEAARMLRDSGADRSAWAVEIAWLAVLAGDVDDVREHVALEEAARRE
jgi:hypothetical protein